MPDPKSGKEWSASDVFDLHQRLQRGYSIEETAEFLGRDVEEIRVKAKELEAAINKGRDA